MNQRGPFFGFNSFQIPPVDIEAKLGRFGFRRSPWVWKLSLAASGIVMLIPVIVMVTGILAASIIFLVLFQVFGLIDRVLRWLGGGGRSGRGGKGGDRDAERDRIIFQDGSGGWKQDE